MIGKSDGGGQFMSFTEVVRIGLFENRLLILKPNPCVFRFIGPSSIAIDFPMIIKSEDHRLEVVTVNIPLHNGISGRPDFSFNKIPETLHISLKLVTIIL